MIKWIVCGDILAKNNRKPISKNLRKKVYLKTNGLCFYCNEPIFENLFHVDHEIAIRYGGTNDFNNLVPSCIPCHKEKTSRDGRVNPYNKKKNIYDDTETIVGEGAEILETSPNTSEYGGRSWFAF